MIGECDHDYTYSKVYAEATGCPCWTALEEKP